LTSNATAQPVGSRPRRQLWLALAVVNLLIVVAILAVLEIALVVMLNHPPPIVLVRRILAGYYTEHDRAIVQFLPECARHDSELGYRLRPGSCRFKNRGFDTRLDINTAGLRDDEASLVGPEVIVLGDSHAMGWGVEGSEAFPSLLERACGRKVLNAAISSYGTARQMRLLHSLDRRSVRWVIVQYSDNDERENFEFKDRNNRLVPMSAENYAGLQRLVERNRTYRPGKHFFRFILFLSNRLLNRAGAAHSAGAEAAADAAPPSIRQDDDVTVFLHALAAAPDLPADVRFIVFEINGRSRNDGAFGKALGTQLATTTQRWPITVLDVAGGLGFDQFLPLDDHMSAQGHRTVSIRIASALGCRG
jgi:hypothetical protein